MRKQEQNAQHEAAKELAERQMSDRKEIQSVKNPNTKPGR